jgi:hypothetical protein
MRQELFGEKHPDVANSLNNLGTTYFHLKNTTSAIDFLINAMEMRKEILGNRHPDTISSAYNLVSVLVGTGNREKAGRLAGEFLSFVPLNHPKRSFFEQYGAMYQATRKKKLKKKRR